MKLGLPSRKNFHLLRLGMWAAQVPLAVLTPLKESVVYLVFLSLAALIESAGTDYDQARQDERERR
jgi:hypothetical protein